MAGLQKGKAARSKERMPSPFLWLPFVSIVSFVVQMVRVMPTFRITLAYDGTDFVGWQRQAAGVSIQGLLEDALRELDGRDVAVHGAGRTDAGVHALGQAASFTIERDIDPATIVRALNAKLPRGDPRARAPTGAGRLPSALRRAPQDLPLSHLERRSDEPVRAPLHVARDRRARHRGDADGGGDARRTARLRGVPGHRQRGGDDRARDLRRTCGSRRTADRGT